LNILNEKTSMISENNSATIKCSAILSINKQVQGHINRDCTIYVKFYVITFSYDYSPVKSKIDLQFSLTQMWFSLFIWTFLVCLKLGRLRVFITIDIEDDKMWSHLTSGKEQKGYWKCRWFCLFF
jgi:hypothetical protein